MNIAILTIQSLNYGNRLQNYALQTVLDGLGNRTCSLRRDAGFHGTGKTNLRDVRVRLGAIRRGPGRYRPFRRFDRDFIALSPGCSFAGLSRQDTEDAKIHSQY